MFNGPAYYWRRFYGWSVARQFALCAPNSKCPWLGAPQKREKEGTHVLTMEAFSTGHLVFIYGLIVSFLGHIQRRLASSSKYKRLYSKKREYKRLSFDTSCSPQCPVYHSGWRWISSMMPGHHQHYQWWSIYIKHYKFYFWMNIKTLFSLD